MTENLPVSSLSPMSDLSHPVPPPPAPGLTRLGVFLNVEDPNHDPAHALHELVNTAVAAEAQGYESVWLAEHHHNAFAIGSALTVLLGHIAALTTRVRLGTGAALLPLNDPVRIAEQVATLDLLSQGRIEFGVGRGGPFPEQYRQVGLASADEARAHLHEALALIRRLWASPAEADGVDFAGRFYRVSGLRLEPKPLQRPVPVWLASLSPDSCELAAEHGDGLMATPSSDLAQVAQVVQAQRARQAELRFAIARFFHCEADPEQARARGLAGVRAYPLEMGVQFAPGKRPPMFEPDAPDEVILANAVIGDPAQCLAQVQRLQALLGPHLLLLKPAAHEPAQARAALGLFMSEMRQKGLVR